MKLSIFVLATITGLASCQCISSIPECAQSCLLIGASSVGCGDTDYACQCTSEHQTDIQSNATTCVLAACGEQTALNQVLPAADAFCSAINAGESCSSSSGAESSTTASSTGSSTGSSTVTTASTSGSSGSDTSPTATLPTTISLTSTSSSATATTGGSSSATGKSTTSSSGTGTATGASASSSSTAGAATMGSVGSLGLVVLGALAML